MKKFLILLVVAASVVCLLAGCSRFREGLSFLQPGIPEASQLPDFPDGSMPDISVQIPMPTDVPTEIPTEAPTEPPKPDTREILISALKDEIPVILENGEEAKICAYLRSRYGIIPKSYAFVDLEGDSECELITQADSKDAAYLILRYSDTGIYAYVLPTRSLWDIKRDGTFSGENPTGFTIIYKMIFSYNTYTKYQVACADWVTNTYDVNGVPCTRDEFNAYANARRSQEAINWELLTDILGT